ncbi:DUF1360 domain-containing protein [Ornithinimicrobium pratense]|uniref:DUF1360 domain-containing protein n=1 Tax=Ornithinimicrobium pratense TaxID=2593973 RepID=A0A5J6V6E9_9MICO|nr:DUF1360 domain-containing protein [Ornithinimicrobium pratense]QFG68613.1 DUF1360 domain-containing protein [Ornithinimicrobium pratense]
MSGARPTRGRFERTVRAVLRQSADDERPLTGYVALGAGYALTAGVALVASTRNGTTGQPVSAGDLARITVATHRLSRLITKETVTAPLRARFTTPVGPGMASEVNEEVATDPHHDPLSHAVGELLTCPFCMAQWTATALVGAHLVAPRQARLATAVLTAVAGADALHFLYASLDRLPKSG